MPSGRNGAFEKPILRLVWTVWGLGLAVMLVLAVLAHSLIGRLYGRSNGRTPTGPSPVPV